MESGRCDHVLVIGADVLSRFTDPSDRGTAALFADGAGAAVVGAANGGPGLIGHIALHSDGSGRPGDPRRATTTRSSTCRATTPSRPRCTACRSRRSRRSTRVGLELDDIGLFVYHQANARILAAVGERLGLDRERVIDCIDRYGNTSSATLPIALADARERGMLEPGMNVVLAAFGAGFTWGAGVIQWGA